MSEWKEVELGEIINLKRGYDLPNSNRVGGGVPIISSSGVTGCHNLHKEIGPGVVTGRYGTLGEFYYIKPGEKYWPLNTTLFVEDFKGNDPEFIYYLLSTLGFGKLGHKSAVPGLNRNELHEILVGIPDSDTQKEIARTLSIIDKKITLLHQQNRDLEDLAQTLFKRWFVEFEFPNENGEPYKSSGGKMVESELGEIPEGWKVASLSSIANFLNGLACQKYPVEDENAKLPVLKIKELGSGISENSDWATSNVDPKYIVQNGDVIFSWSGTLMLKIWDGDDCVLNQHLFKVTSQQFPQWFINQWTRIHLQYFILVAQSKATTMGHIKRSHLDEALCLIPSDKVLTQCNGAFDSMFVSFVNNNKEIRTLIKLRDTLLPKLMSGELRVKSK